MGVTKRDFQVVYTICGRDPSTYQNTPGPSGHTNVKLGGIRGCSYRTSSWHWVDSMYSNLKEKSVVVNPITCISIKLLMLQALHACFH